MSSSFYYFSRRTISNIFLIYRFNVFPFWPKSWFTYFETISLHSPSFFGFFLSLTRLGEVIFFAKLSIFNLKSAGRIIVKTFKKQTNVFDSSYTSSGGMMFMLDRLRVNQVTGKNTWYRSCPSTFLNCTK